MAAGDATSVEVTATPRSRVDEFLAELSPRMARLLALLTITASALLGVLSVRAMSQSLVMPVAAQTNVEQVSSIMCTTGIGHLVGFALAAISMFLVIIAVIQGTVAFNKMGSSRAQDQYEGKQALKGAGTTGAGAFVPPVFAIVMEQVLGIQTFGCIQFDPGLINIGMTVVPHLPV